MNIHETNTDSPTTTASQVWVFENSVTKVGGAVNSEIQAHSTVCQFS